MSYTVKGGLSELSQTLQDPRGAVMQTLYRLVRKRRKAKGVSRRRFSCSVRP